MEMTRREFLKESLSALGFLALPGGWLFASPPGWKPKGKPNLVFGVISDTHLRTAVNGNRHDAHWPDKDSWRDAPRRVLLCFVFAVATGNASKSPCNFFREARGIMIY